MAPSVVGLRIPRSLLLSRLLHLATVPVHTSGGNACTAVGPRARTLEGASNRRSPPSFGEETPLSRGWVGSAIDGPVNLEPWRMMMDAKRVAWRWSRALPRVWEGPRRGCWPSRTTPSCWRAGRRKERGKRPKKSHVGNRNPTCAWDRRSTSAASRACRRSPGSSERNMESCICL